MLALEELVSCCCRTCCGGGGTWLLVAGRPGSEWSMGSPCEMHLLGKGCLVCLKGGGFPTPSTPEIKSGSALLWQLSALESDVD